jgi:aminomethyltransferase
LPTVSRVFIFDKVRRMVAYLQRTPLYDWHCAQNARMITSGRWELPELYSSVAREYNAVQNHVGVIDLSHLTRFTFEGPGACSFLNSLLPQNIETLKSGEVRYALLINENGGIIDDLLVGLFPREGTNMPCYRLFGNACNWEKNVNYFKSFLILEDYKGSGRSVFFSDETTDRSMIAVMGPRAPDLLQPLFQTETPQLKYLSGKEILLWSGRPVLIFRTGLQLREEFIVVLESFFAEQFVEFLFERGKTFGIAPFGLTTKETMRLEDGIPSYGYELSEEINPFEAGLESALFLDSPDFINRNILLELQNQTPSKIRVGLEISGVPIDGTPPIGNDSEIFCEQQKIGQMTSGIFSPFLQKFIAMGYVPPKFSQLGQPLVVKNGERCFNAAVVPIPFEK